MAIPAVVMAAGKYLATKCVTDENFRKSVMETVKNISEKTPSRIRHELEHKGILPRSLGGASDPADADSGAFRKDDTQMLRARVQMAAATGDELGINRILATTPSSKLALALPGEKERADLISNLANHGLTDALNNLRNRPTFSVGQDTWKDAFETARKANQPSRPDNEDTVSLMDDLTRSSGKNGRYLVAAKLWEEYIKPNSMEEAREFASINETVTSTNLMERLNSPELLEAGISGFASGLPISAMPQNILAEIREQSGNFLDGLASIQEKGAASVLSQASGEKNLLSEKLRSMEPRIS